MQMKSLHLIGLIGLAAAALHGQPTNGPLYWSTTPPDCSSLNYPTPVQVKNGSTLIGYSCYVSGTFEWFAAGGGWGTAIRVAAPATAPIGVDYTFYDSNGISLSLDTTGSYAGSSTEVDFALSADQPTQLDLFGATSDAATNYSSTSTGSVYAEFFCPDATTCSNVLPQLLYSALPSSPWSLSVPIAWDGAASKQWSAEGVDDGAAHRVSFAIYNEDITATSYNVYVYDSSGNLFGTGTTPSVAPLQDLGGGIYGEGGTYAEVLSAVVSPLPTGIFKVLFDGGSLYSAVVVTQVNGPSATTLQVAYDTAPSSTASAAAVRRTSVRRLRAAPTPKQVFKALPR